MLAAQLPHPTPKPPGVVTAAAVTTIAAAGITGMLVILNAFVGATVLSYFDDTGVMMAFLAVVVVVAMCSLAVVASVGLLRRRRWSWWALLVLSPITFVLGFMASYYVLPLAGSTAALAVFVLLLLRPTRGWLFALPSPGAETPW